LLEKRRPRIVRQALKSKRRSTRSKLSRSARSAALWILWRQPDGVKDTGVSPRARCRWKNGRSGRTVPIGRCRQNVRSTGVARRRAGHGSPPAWRAGPFWVEGLSPAQPPQIDDKVQFSASTMTTCVLPIVGWVEFSRSGLRANPKNRTGGIPFPVPIG